MPEEKKTENDEQQTSPEQTGEEDANQQAGESGEADESNEESDKESDSGDEGSNDEGGDDLPDWARQTISKANAEAANYRTKLREAEDKLKDAKSLEEVDQIISEMKAERETAERELIIENVALKFKLPEKIRGRLTGNTREELEADAKELAELFGTDDEYEDPDLEGGLSPRSRDDEPNDPRSLARKYGRGSKRR